MKKVMSIVSLLCGISPVFILFIWRMDFMRRPPTNYIVLGLFGIAIIVGFIMAVYLFGKKHLRDLTTKLALVFNSFFLVVVAIIGGQNVIFRIFDLIHR